MFWITWLSFFGLYLKQSKSIFCLLFCDKLRRLMDIGHYVHTHTHSQTHTQSHEIFNQLTIVAFLVISELAVQVSFSSVENYTLFHFLLLLWYIYSVQLIHVLIHQWDGITKWYHSNSFTDLIDPTLVACVLWDVSPEAMDRVCLSSRCHLKAIILEFWQN